MIGKCGVSFHQDRIRCNRCPNRLACVQSAAAAAGLEEAEVAGQKIAKAVDMMMPKGWRFVVAMFMAGGGPRARASYVSNCDRASAIKALREVADKMERKEVV